MTQKAYNILGISGSLRAASYNTLILRAMGERANNGSALENTEFEQANVQFHLANLKGIPVYDGDL